MKKINAMDDGVTSFLFLSLSYCSLSLLWMCVLIFLIVAGFHDDTDEQWVHIDTFSAMNGISRFCESDLPWRYNLVYFLCTVLIMHQVNFAWILLKISLCK